jgi:pSer/pThr/pTyr-binding forkhead associated (FHA) protein
MGIRSGMRKKACHKPVSPIMPRVTITVPGNNPQPYRFQLDRKQVTMGRGSSNDIVIDCPSVSVIHAEMRRVEGGYELRDLESTNGIKLDGERRKVIPLHSGHAIHLGDVAFDFQLSDEELEALARERPLEDTPVLREPVEAPEHPALPPLPKVQAAEGPHNDPVTRPGCGSIIGTLLLVLIVLCVGMAIRFQRETGSSWLGAVNHRFLVSMGLRSAEPIPETTPATPAADPADATDATD